MRKAHATRHRRQATRAQEVERARRIQVAIEVEERRRAAEDARWNRERHRYWGMPIVPAPAHPSFWLAPTIASELRALAVAVEAGLVTADAMREGQDARPAEG